MNTALPRPLLLAFAIALTAAPLTFSPLAAAEGKVTAIKGVPYAVRGATSLLADVYMPKGDGPAPGVLVVHGGAWMTGNKARMERVARRLAEHGYTAVAINYRLAPQNPFPAQIEDCKAAVRWMRRNADKYKIDPERIGGYGYSAGGQLVALLGTTDATCGLEGVDDETLSTPDVLQSGGAARPVSEVIPRPGAVVEAEAADGGAADVATRFGPQELEDEDLMPRDPDESDSDESEAAPADAATADAATAGADNVVVKNVVADNAVDRPAANPCGTRLQCVVAGGAPCDFRMLPLQSPRLSYWLGGTRAAKTKLYEQASPASFITADDPPMFFFHGAIDAVVPLESPRDMARRMTAAGLEATLHVVPNAGHIAAFLDDAAATSAIKFLDAHLKAK